MSGPCTDCGGPDYQTLTARIAKLEAITEGQLKTITRMNEACVQAEAAGADMAVENGINARGRVAAEAQLVAEKDEYAALEYRLEQAEAERDAKASAYTNTLKCLGRQAETIWELNAELARVQSCLAQGKGLAR